MPTSMPSPKRSTIARYSIATAAGMVVLTAFAACVWRPDSLAALTLVPPWCWFVAGLLTLPLLWRAQFKRLVFGLALFWIVFAIGWVEEVPSLVRVETGKLTWTSAGAGKPLRIVSLNCGGSERCMADLQLVHADIVLLQEVPGEEGLARMTSQLFGDAGQFCKAGDVAILATGSVTQQAADKGGTFVTACIQLRDAPPIDCISLRLAPPSSRLDFWTPGFWSEHRELRQRHRSQLATAIQSLNSNQPDRAIAIGGDFNTLPLDAALDQLRPRFRDSFAATGVGWGATGTNDWPLFRVDQIWSNALVTPTRTFSRKTAHSDHRMVICDMTMQQ